MTTEINKNKILNVLILIFVIISLLIVGYIFSNSLDNVEQSNEKSEVISEKVQQVVDPEKRIEKPKFHEYVRKAAHVTEFCALGLSVGIVFLLVFYRTKKRFLVTPLLFCFCVGITDEYIQSYSDRACQLTDVMLDMLGAVAGLAVVAVAAVSVMLIVRQRKKKSKN